MPLADSDALACVSQRELGYLDDDYRDGGMMAVLTRTRRSAARLIRLQRRVLFAESVIGPLLVVVPLMGAAIMVWRLSRCRHAHTVELPEEVPALHEYAVANGAADASHGSPENSSGVTPVKSKQLRVDGVS